MRLKSDAGSRGARNYEPEAKGLYIGISPPKKDLYQWKIQPWASSHVLEVGGEKGWEVAGEVLP